MTVPPFLDFYIAMQRKRKANYRITIKATKETDRTASLVKKNNVKNPREYGKC